MSETREHRRQDVNVNLSGNYGSGSASAGAGAEAKGGAGPNHSSPHSSPTAWELRVYLASDPTESLAERDELARRVVPELRKLCRQRGGELTLTDLNWRSEDSRARPIERIDARFDEIDRSSPYFIGLLGERLGEPCRLAGEPGLEALLRREPWLAEAMSREQSSLELELRRGLLRAPAESRSIASAVYARRPAPGRAIDERMAAMKRELIGANVRLRDQLESPETVADWIRRDLESWIDRRFPLGQTVTPLDQVRRRQRAIASWQASRPSATAAANARILEQLNDLALNDGPPAAISGPRDAASAILAGWLAQLPQGVATSTAWAADSPADLEPFEPLHRLVSEIRDQSHSLDEAPRTPSRLLRDFGHWLANAPRERFIAVIDGLERFASDLTWLPSASPRHVRLIAACESGPALIELRRRGWVVLQAQGVAEPSAESLNAMAAGWEGRFGGDRVRQALTALWAARRGLTETEWVEISAWPRLDLLLLAHELKPFLIECDGVLTLADSTVREWVRQRWLTSPETVRESHRRLARYFIEQPFSDRRADELVWQCRWSEEWNALAAVLAEIPTFMTFCDEERRHELINDWALLEDKHDPEVSYRISLERFQARGPDSSHLCHVMHELGHFFHLAGRLEAGEQFYRRVLSIREMTLGPNHPLVAQTSNNLAGLLHAKGDFQGAETLYRRALSIAEATMGPQHPHTLQSLNNLALLLRAREDNDGAIRIFRRVLEARETLFGRRHPQNAHTHQHLGELMLARGDLEQALKHLEKALKIREATLGPDHPLVASVLHDIAAVMDAGEEFAEADRHYRKALAIRERTLGEDHVQTADTLNELALTLHSQEKLVEAEPLYRRALAIREKLLGPEHVETATSLNNLAELLRSLSKFDEAEPLYRRALAIDEATQGPDHPQTGISLNNLGLLLIAKGENTEAEVLFRRALTIAQKSLGVMHPQTAIAFDNLAELKRLQKEFDEAESLLGQALTIREGLLGKDHPHTKQTRSALESLVAAKSSAAPPAPAVVPLSLPVAEAGGAGGDDAALSAPMPVTVSMDLLEPSFEKPSALEIPDIFAKSAPTPTPTPTPMPPVAPAAPDPVPSASLTAPSPADLIAPALAALAPLQSQPQAETETEAPAIPQVAAPAPPEVEVEVEVEVEAETAPASDEPKAEAEPEPAPVLVAGSSPVLEPKTEPEFQTEALATEMVSRGDEPAPKVDGWESSWIEPAAPADEPEAPVEYEFTLPRPADLQSESIEPEPVEPEAELESPVAEEAGAIPDASETMGEFMDGAGASLISSAQVAGSRLEEWAADDEDARAEEEEEEEGRAGEFAAARESDSGEAPASEDASPSRFEAPPPSPLAFAAPSAVAGTSPFEDIAPPGLSFAPPPVHAPIEATLPEALSSLAAEVPLATMPAPTTVPDEGTTSAMEGIAHERGGRLEAAEQSYRRSLGVRETSLRPDHPLVAQTLEDLARTLRKRGRWVESERLYRRALSIQEQRHGANHPRTATARAGLAWTLKSSGDLGAAESEARSALKVREQALGPNHPQTAASYSQVAGLLQARGDLGEAENLHRRALMILESGPPTYLTAHAHNNLGSLLLAKGDHAGAKSCYRRAIEILDQTRGPRHHETASALRNLATLHLATGDLENAESRYRQALSIYEATLGEDHHLVAQTHYHLGRLHQHQGNADSAAVFLRKALEIQERLSPNDEPDPAKSQTLNSLGGLFLMQGDFANAEAAFQRASKVRERAFGGDHPLTAETLHNLGLASEAKGDFAAAEAAHFRALRIRERHLGPDHAATIRSRYRLIPLLHRGKNLPELEVLLRQTLETASRVYGAGHPHTAVAHKNFGGLLMSKQDYGAARDHYRRAYKIEREKLGAEHSMTLETQRYLEAVEQLAQGWSLGRMFRRKGE